MSKYRVSKALRAHGDTLSQAKLSQLFAQSPQRFAQFSMKFEGLFLDYSRNLMVGETLELLIAHLAQTDFEDKRAALLSGQLRYDDLPAPVMHTALRGGDDVPADMRDELAQAQDRFLSFAEDVRNGNYTGADGQAIRDVVNLGIGGGHLGAALVCAALAQYAKSDDNGDKDSVRAHCISAADTRDLRRLLKHLDPATTLFVISSRSFTTSETIHAAHIAREWIEDAGLAWDKHFAAATSDTAQANKFGIAKDKCFVVPTGVNGRTSLWSAAGLVPAILIGRACFEEMIKGGNAMDEHFKTADLEHNMPVILALINIWHTDVCNYGSQAILVYEGRLKQLPAYLQQLHLESNGKSVNVDGEPLTYSAPVVWGGAGIDGQHAYYQMLHQGTRLVACDFILTAEQGGEFAHANCMAQARALMEGCEHDDPQQRLPGNRSSTILLMKKLTPEYLGMLIALYEHKVFIQSVMWGINPFSQWGVELGKKLAKELQSLVRGESSGGVDPATAGINKQYQAWHKENKG